MKATFRPFVRKRAMQWWSKLSSARKTEICDTNGQGISVRWRFIAQMFNLNTKDNGQHKR